MRIVPSILRSSHARFSTQPKVHRPICFRHRFLHLLAAVCLAAYAYAQDDPLNKVHVPPPSTPGTPAPGAGAPAGAEAPAVSGTAATKARPGAMIRMNVDMVLVPVTVTDPMNRLVTGLEREDFQVYENNGQQ
jgi:Ca-activated chloride channel family protein